MKQTIAAACLVAIGSNAAAQSTLAIYGTLDQYLAFTKSGAARSSRLDDGGNTASRLGFIGSEDLGGGWRANITLEAGFSPDTGNGTLPGPGLAFTRQSFVGLGGPWGRIDAGRMYTPLFYALLRADPFNINSVYSPLNLISANDAQPGLAAFTARASNMLRYRTPADGRWLVDLAYAPGEASDASRRSGDMRGATIGWNAKPFYLAYAVQKNHSGTAAMPVESPATSTFQAVSAAWDVSDTWRLNANYVRNTSSITGVLRADLLNLSTAWSVGALRLLGGVIRRRVDDSPRGQQGWTLGADYALSKRTALYTRLLHLNNGGGSAVSLAGIAVAAGSGDSVRSLAFGVRHNF